MYIVTEVDEDVGVGILGSYTVCVEPTWFNIVGKKLTQVYESHTSLVLGAREDRHSQRLSAIDLICGSFGQISNEVIKLTSASAYCPG
jgi:hypothetical protein